MLVAAEEVRARLRRRLVEEYGVDEADMLLDPPPGGWGEVVTRDWLQLVLDARFAPIYEKLASIEQGLGSNDDSFVSIERRFDSIDARFVSMEHRFDSIDARFVSMEHRFDGKFASMDSRLTSIETEIRAETWKLVAAMTGLLGALVAAIKL